MRVRDTHPFRFRAVETAEVLCKGFFQKNVLSEFIIAFGARCGGGVTTRTVVIHSWVINKIGGVLFQKQGSFPYHC